MRINKYRGFDSITKKFIYGNLLFTNETYYIIPFLTNGCMSQKEMMLRWISPCYQVVSETVGQFTGLHDKNGVEIYTGDKVIIEKEDDEEIFVVKWDNNTARFIMDSETYVLDFDNYDGTDCEVIGNTHQKGDILE